MSSGWARRQRLWWSLSVGITVAVSVQAGDNRLRAVPYDSETVYALRGIPGYQIDLQFDRDERFVGLASGDVEALTFEAQDDHLFIKPKAIHVRTNLTVLTSRRVYHFDYSVAGPHDLEPGQNAMYALRFEYPPVQNPGVESPQAADLALAQPAGARNSDYWYCGAPSLQPNEAWDDGLHTHLRFEPGAELPAVFIRNDDGSESLLNFNVESDEIVIHRIARQLVVRRGALLGCIVNRGFHGGGSVRSGTVSPDVERATRAVAVTP
jgi:type IV secretion system protein VirB9